jgi:hypothetical protein
MQSSEKRRCCVEISRNVGNEENLTEPRQQMLNDLEERTRERKRENHENILMDDWNEDICRRELTNFINKLEMKEAILSRHGTRHAPLHTLKALHPSMVSSQREVSAYKVVDIWHSQKGLKASQTTERRGSM